MAIEVFQLQADSVTAEQLRRSTNVEFARNGSGSIGTVAGGIVPGTAGDLQVSAPVSGLNVNVAAGECIVPGSVSFASTPSGYYVRNTGIQNVTGFTANPSNPTIYAVVVTIADAAYHGASNTATIVAVGGTPTTGATLTNLTGAPAIPDASLLLAWVLVPTAATNIVTADVLNASAFQWNSSVDQYNGGVATNLYMQTPALGIIRDSSGGNKTLKPYQHYIVSTGSPTYTLPAPFQGAIVKVTNCGSGVPVVSQNASEKIFGPGCTSSGVSSVSLGSYGAFIELQSDGTSWYTTAGQQDSGWLTVGGTGVAFTNSFANSGGFTTQYRKLGNRVEVQGRVTTGSAGTSAFTLPTGFRPTTNQLDFAQDANLSFGAITIATAGTVIANYTTYCDVNCTFLAD